MNHNQQQCNGCAQIAGTIPNTIGALANLTFLYALLKCFPLLSKINLSIENILEWKRERERERGGAGGGGAGWRHPR